jgi:hypothetical protein
MRLSKRSFGLVVVLMLATGCHKRLDTKEAVPAASAPSPHADPDPKPQPTRDWTTSLGSPQIADSVARFVATQRTARLPDAHNKPKDDHWVPLADTCSALVNAHALSHDEELAKGARRIADYLLESNDWLVAHAAPGIPYVGWGPETRKGYFTCGDVTDFHADDLWDTANAMRCLLKVAEMDPRPVESPYFVRAKRIADGWRKTDFASSDRDSRAPRLRADGPYAAAGLRWYAKSNESCENRYVKNTNIAMGEQLFRLWRIGREPAHLEAAKRVLHSQLWDDLTHQNLGYASFMIRLDESDPSYAEQSRHEDKKTVRTKAGGLVCSRTDTSCWNHLAFEAFALGNIGELIRDIPDASFPVPSTKRDIVTAIDETMAAYRTSEHGNTRTFDWPAAARGQVSATHITAYNCALRTVKAVYAEECSAALAHPHSGGTVSYGLLPDALAVRKPSR